MKNWLIIYEEVPEDNRLFLIPEADLSDEDKATLRVVAGLVVNNMDLTAEQEKAYTAFAALTSAGQKKSKWSETWAPGKFAKYLIGKELLTDASISTVVWVAILV